MHKSTIVEDQLKFAITLNRDTEKLYYNQRLIVDNNILTEPRAWQISKVNRIMPGGIAIITLAQTKFDGDKDYVEIDKTTEEVIGLWADYFVGNTEATDPVETDSIHVEITYPGKPTIRVPHPIILILVPVQHVPVTLIALSPSWVASHLYKKWKFCN